MTAQHTKSLRTAPFSLPPLRASSALELYSVFDTGRPKSRKTLVCRSQSLTDEDCTGINAPSPESCVGAKTDWTGTTGSSPPDSPQEYIQDQNSSTCATMGTGDRGNCNHAVASANIPLSSAAVNDMRHAALSTLKRDSSRSSRRD